MLKIWQRPTEVVYTLVVCWSAFRPFSSELALHGKSILCLLDKKKQLRAPISWIFIRCFFCCCSVDNTLTWSEPRGLVGVGTQPGLSTLTVDLPILTAEQRERFSQFDVEWRAVGDSTWQSTNISASSSTVTLPRELAVDSYEIRVSAKSSDGTATSDTVGPLQFSISPSGIENTTTNVIYIPMFDGTLFIRKRDPIDQCKYLMISWGGGGGGCRPCGAVIALWEGNL